MSDKPPRRFWQVHLSTAIVLMFVAGALLLANMTKRETWVRGEFIQKMMTTSGWPLPDRTYKEYSRNDGRFGHIKRTHETANVAANVFIALCILGWLAFILECRIREAEQ